MVNPFAHARDYGRSLVGGIALCVAAFAQNPSDAERLAPSPAELVARENSFYARITLPVPDDIVLEVGGLLALPGKRLLAATRRGELWWIDGAYEDNRRPRFTRFASGLHTVLGLAIAPGGGFYVVQRGEVTRLADTNNDGRADRFDTVFKIPASGNFHEYAYGPVVAPDGSMRITLNLAGGAPNPSSVPWRGWMLELTPDGAMTPIAAGMRSPAAFVRTMRGEWFYAENQGEWIASGWVGHVERGDFFGHPASLAWSGRPGSPVKLTARDIGSPDLPWPEAVKKIPGLKLPAVWFPQAIMGISTADIIEDTTGGAFGPFAGQFFVSDQGQSKIMRMSLERVGGVYQGACYPFRSGLESGTFRLAWGDDGSLFAGSTNRGWGSIGEKPYGLERLRWTGRAPFEMQEITATPDGFRIAFTEPVDTASAVNPASYTITGFTYNYHRAYGSAVVNRTVCPVLKIVAESDRVVRLAVACLREGYIHEVRASGLRKRADATPLLHDTGYYTLNRLPEGETLVPAALLTAEWCSPSAAPVSAAASPRHTTARPPGWPAGSEIELRVRAIAGLKFEPARLAVPRGARVKLTLENADDMLHNWVLTTPQQGQPVGAAALAMGLDGPARHYVPDSPHVLAHTAVVAPHAVETIYFTAPSAAGDYDYICSFPGHAPLMNGILSVE